MSDHLGSIQWCFIFVFPIIKCDVEYFMPFTWSVCIYPEGINHIDNVVEKHLLCQPCYRCLEILLSWNFLLFPFPSKLIVQQSLQLVLRLFEAWRANVMSFLSVKGTSCEISSSHHICSGWCSHIFAECPWCIRWELTQ